ncbi:hypothetical protein BSKO_03746 [Bryopsis sp. KO-2023]|nr:hypothetical protein BSKO_03746 [Bryopsis sp. KO-2023]
MSDDKDKEAGPSREEEGEPSDARIRELFQALSLQASPPVNQKREKKDHYMFWSSQPVTQFDDSGAEGVQEDGPIDRPKTVADVRQEPLNLPNGYEWCTCDVSDEETIAEVYKLLTNNYVEDGDNMFRFDYSAGFLKWALMPPGYRQEWLVGVRVVASKKLVGFITAIPASIRVKQQIVSMVEINFLCVHKKLRSKRLAPVLIKEITRRVNLTNIWQAAYTAGVVLPTPVATCRYWHRSLNPKKLIEVGFSKLGNLMTMARTVKLYRLPKDPKTPGFREMLASDSPRVLELLNQYLLKYKLAPVFTLEEIEHWLVPRDDVVNAYVVENHDGEITDLVSFYSLPSSILGNPKHSSLKAAYMYYTVPGATSINQLMTDALIMAKSCGFDVYNALDILQNNEFLRDLKFGEGDGYLQYYLYNWRVVEKMRSEEVGLVLL